MFSVVGKIQGKSAGVVLSEYSHRQIAKRPMDMQRLDPFPFFGPFLPLASYLLQESVINQAFRLDAANFLVDGADKPDRVAYSLNV